MKPESPPDLSGRLANFSSELKGEKPRFKDTVEGQGAFRYERAGATRGRTLSELLGGAVENIPVLSSLSRFFLEDKTDRVCVSTFSLHDKKFNFPDVRYTTGRYDLEGVAEISIEGAVDAKAEVILARETPLSTIHLRNMLTLSELGAILVAAAPAFYHKPQTVMDIVHQSLGKALDQVGIEHNLFERWTGQDRGQSRK